MPVSTAEEIQLESLTTALNELSKPLLASDTLSADSYTDQLEGAVRIAFAPCSSTVLESLHLYGHEHLYRYRSLEKNPASNDSAKRTDTSTLITAHTHHHDTDRGVSHDDLSDKGAWQWAMAVLDILLAIHCTLLKSKTGHAVSGNSPVSLANARATVESFDVTKRSDPNAVQFGANSANDNGNGDNRESALKQSSVMPKSFIEEITSDTTSMSQPGASIPRTKLLIEEISSDKTPVKRPDAAPPSHATDNKDAGALSLSQSMSVRKAIRVLVYAVLVPLLDSELATSLQHYLPQTVAEVALHKKRTSKKEQQKASARARPLTSPVYNFLYLLAAKHESGNWIARTGREEKLAVVVKRIAVWLGAKQGDTTEVTYLTAMHFAYPVLLSALQLAYGGADPTSTSSKDDCIGLDTTTADRSDDLNPRIKIGQKRKQDFAHLLVVLRHRMPLNVVMEAFAQLLALRDLPSSLQPVCSRILTKCLMMQNGVLCLLTHLLSSCETVSDVTAAATQTMRLVINCPRWMAKSKDAYYANICTQLYHLLHLRSSDSSVLNSVSNISRRLPHAVMILIHGMILKHPILARKHLISRMCAAFDVRFVEAGSEPYRPTLSGTQSTPSWVSELRIPVSDIWQCINQDAHTEEVGSSVNTAFITTWDPIVIEQAIQFAVEDMHKVFVAGLSASGDLNGREKSDMLGAVRSYIPILLALFSFTAEYPGVSLSTAVNELVGKILSAIDEDDAVEALFTFLDPGARPDTADVESKQDVHTTFELMSGSRNGVSYRWMPQTERNFAHDCQCVINLLGTLKRTALAGEFFVRLVEALGQVADETDEAGRDIAAASTGNFLHGGGGLSDAEIDRKRSYLLLSQCLGQLVQSLDVSVIKRTRHVIVFAKLLATSADDETTCMALGLLTTILTGNAVTVSKDDEADIAELRGWLEPFANHPNEEIAEIALDLITNIQTRNPLWQELQEQTTNIQTVDHHNSTKPEVSIDASGSGSSSQKAQITDIGNETKSLDNDMGLLPPSKNANSGTNDDAQPSAALVTEYESFSTAMLQLKDPMLPVRAHALVLLRRLLERRDESVRGKEQVILDILVTQIRQLDSYIYLAAIQGLVVLCLEDPLHMIPALCEKFLDSDKKLGESVQAKLGEVLYGIVEAGHAQITTPSDNGDLSEDAQQKNATSFVDPNAIRPQLSKAHINVIVDAMLKVANTFQPSNATTDPEMNNSDRQEAKNNLGRGEGQSDADLIQEGMVISSSLAILARVCELRCDVVAPRVTEFIGCVTKVMSTYSDTSRLERIGQDGTADVQMVTVLSSTQNDDDDEFNTDATDDVLNETDLPADVRFPGMKVHDTDDADEDLNAADSEHNEEGVSQKMVVDPCLLVRRGAMNLATMIFRGFDPYFFALMAPSLPPLITLLGKVGTDDADIITRTHAQVALDDANELFKSWAALAGFTPSQPSDTNRSVPHPKILQ